MSEVPNSNIEIFISLLDEGIDVWRPTQAKLVGPQEFLVLPTPNYNPETEHWEFPPGSVVECVLEHRDDGDIMVARKLVR